jgi:hypothetical protein
MQKKIILDTFTLHETEKDMPMHMWVEVNRYHRKPEDKREREKKNENESNYIYTRIHKLFLYINETINTTTTAKKE